MTWPNVLAVVLGVLAITLRSSAALNLFANGKEYKYQYETLVTAGSEEPTSYASSYRLKGTLTVQGTDANTVRVKLDEVKIGLYNGPWSYFPVPEFDYFATSDLSPLSEPFQIITENGKFKTLIMNDQEPEWASNLKRGFATYLQMDLQQVHTDELQIFKTLETTTMGECDTNYEVLPVSSTNSGLGRISKFRNHADCPDLPKRIRHATEFHPPCPNKITRDILNSTAYATYDITTENSQITVQRLQVLSSILYWPFTTNGPFLYSWLNMTLALDSVSATTSPLGSTENPESHEDLTFVFEQSDTSDPDEELIDLKTAEPLLFHYATTESDPEIQMKLMEICHTRLEEVAESLSSSKAFEDMTEFHKKSPFYILPIISSLDYDSLKSCYKRYSETSSTSQSKSIEFQLFLDGLLFSGTSATTLVIRDILLESEDPKVINRLAMAFPHFIRNPTEQLAKEMDGLFALVEKPSLSKTTRRIIELSLASYVSRSCAKNPNCELLEKYIVYFEKKLAENDHFEEQAVAIHGLRNLGRGRAFDKVLTIATGKTNHERTIQLHAIWSLRSLAFRQPARVFGALLPIFFNRSEPCELRSSVFDFLSGSGIKEKTLLEIVYYMWTETCPQTVNMVRSKLTVMANTEFPCNSMKTAARTILKYLPPGKIDPTRTASYTIDYFDTTYGFGQLFFSSVQKSGSSALPVSVYLGAAQYIGGYFVNNFGVSIRIQGLGKTVLKKISDMNHADVEEIAKLLASIQVESRPKTPLKLELTLIYQNRVLLHYAADENSLMSLPAVFKMLQEIHKDFKSIGERALVLGAVGGLVYQQPLEIGTPVSLVTGFTAIGSMEQKIPSNRMASYELESRLQANVFAMTLVANHVPAIGTVHTVTSLRSARLRLPSHLKLGFDAKKMEINFGLVPPKKSNPVALTFHATTVTAVKGDNPTGIEDISAIEKLHKSCASCSHKTVVTRGDSFRKSRKLPLKLPEFFKGIRSGIEYFDCERDHSRTAMLKKVRNVFGDTGKNSGFFASPVTKIFLGVQYASRLAFLSPYAETCGITAYLSQDDTAPTKLTKIEGSLKAKKDATSKASITSKLSLKYTGEQASSTKLELLATMDEPNLNNGLISVKMTANDPVAKIHGVVCIDINAKAKLLTNDAFCYVGENEPFVKQKIDIKMGKISPGSDTSLDINSVPCLDNHVSIQITGEVKRSKEQVHEAAEALLPFYSQCNSQKNSESFPGTYVPPTVACYQSLFEQTNLRSINSTIHYKVNKEVGNRWRKPAILLGSVLAPFLLDPEEDHHHVHPSGHNHAADASGNFEGEIEVDINIKKNHPILDLHFTPSGNGHNEQHYHNVDLSLLPDVLQPSPVPSRISPLILFGLKTGLVGMCTASQNSVLTFDSFAYSTQLTECLTLISADCSSDTQFAVLGRKIANNKIALTVYLGEQQIKLEGSREIIVDGKTVPLTDQKLLEEDETRSFKAMKNGDEIFMFSISQGIYVRYTGYFVSVALGSRYRGVQCGLCGTWDSSLYNDLRGPKTCSKPLSPNDMAKAYIVPEGSCASQAKSCP